MLALARTRRGNRPMILFQNIVERLHVSMATVSSSAAAWI